MRDHIDLAHTIKRGMSIPPASKAAGTHTGTALDWTDSPSEVLVEISVGAVASGASAVITLQESSNNNTADASGAADPYANINDGEASPTDLSTTINSTHANSIVTLRVQRRSKKWLRAKAVVSTDAIVMGVNFQSVRRDNMA